MKHPLHVTYPYGGRGYLLHWWTYDDRGHFIVASNERALRSVAGRVFWEHPDATIKGYTEVEFVAPSEELQRLAEKQALEKVINHFYFEVLYRLREVEEAGYALPPPFDRCPKFEMEDWEDSIPDAWAMEHHSGCKHCHEGIRLVGMTRGDFYAKFFSRWQEANPDRAPSPVDKTRLVSRARVARDDEPLWRVYADFGPHAGGLGCESMRVEGEPTLGMDGMLGYGYVSLEDNALFFYVPLRDLPTSELEAVLQARKAEVQREQDIQEQKRKDDRERDDRERTKAVLDFFGMGAERKA